MKLHHVDGPRVARELGHHFAGSQIPELGQGGWRSGPGRAPQPPALPPVQPRLCPHTTFPSAQLGTATPRRAVGTSLSVTSSRQAPALGPGPSGSYLHCVVICSRCQPLPVGAEPETPHGLAVPLRRTEHRLTLGAWPRTLPPHHPTPPRSSTSSASWGAGNEGKTCRRCHRGTLPRGTMDSQACRGSRKPRLHGQSYASF